MKLPVVKYLSALLLSGLLFQTADAATVSQKVEARVNASSGGTFTTPICGAGKCGNNSATGADSRNSAAGKRKPIPWSAVSNKTNNAKIKPNNAATVPGSSDKSYSSRDAFSLDYFNRDFSDTVDFSAGSDSYVRRNNEGLWRIAENTRGKNVSVHKQISALYRKNLACFINGNINEIVPNCQIKLPTAEQVQAEYEQHGKQLLYFAGVESARHRFAVENCRYGVCSAKSSAVSDQKVEETPSMAIAKADNLTDTAGKTPTTDAELKNAKLEIKLLDQDGRNVAGDVLQPKDAVEQKTEKNTEKNTAAAVTAGIDQEAFEKYGKTLNERLARDYGAPIEQLKSEIKQLNANQVTINRELKDEIQALNKRIDELTTSVEELAKNQVAPVETKVVVKEESSNLNMWIAIIAGILFVLSFVAYYIVTKTKKINPDEMGDEEDAEDINDGIDGLMSINTMNGAGGDLNIDDEMQSLGASSQINLNSGETDQINQEKQEGFVLQDNNVYEENNNDLVPPNVNQEENPQQPAENVSQPSIANYDLNEPSEELRPIRELKPKNFDEWDENSFDENAFDLANDNNLDDIITQLSNKKSGKKTAGDMLDELDSGESKGAADSEQGIQIDVNDLMNSVPDNKTAAASGDGLLTQAAAGVGGDLDVNDEMSDEEENKLKIADAFIQIDDKQRARDMLKEILSDPNASPKAVEAAARQMANIKDSVPAQRLDTPAEPEETSVSAEQPGGAAVDSSDIDDLIGSVQSQSPAQETGGMTEDEDQKLKMADAFIQIDDKDGARDLLQEILGNPSSTSEAVVAAEELMAKLPAKEQKAAPASEEKKPVADEKVSNDDLDDLLASVQADMPKAEEKKPAADEKVSNDDLDDLLASVQADMPKAEEKKPATDEKVSNDDLDDLLESVQADMPKAEEKKPAADEKVSNDDLDDLLESVQADIPKAEEKKPAADEKVSNDDLDDLLASVQADMPKAEEKKPAADGKVSNDDLDDLLASVQADMPKEEKKPAADEKVSNDDLDDLLASVQADMPKEEKKPESAGKSINLTKKPKAEAKKSKAGEKVNNADIDDILNLVNAPNGQEALDAEVNNLIDQAQEELSRYEPDHETPEMTEEESNQLKLAEAFIQIDDKEGAREILHEIMKNSITKAFSQASKMLESL
ncbi:MAG: hypothetical protein K5752_02075 [Succinivibrionaceae bacterium]|nr:hypothetical protein [Succinivibrionaceae bacterium]